MSKGLPWLPKRKIRDDWSTVPKFFHDPQGRGARTSNSNKKVKLNGVDKWAAPHTLVSENDMIIRVNPGKNSRGHADRASGTSGRTTPRTHNRFCLPDHVTHVGNQYTPLL